MLKTTVYLDEEILLMLRRLADADKRSQADIIREALHHYLQRIQAPNPNLPAGIGRYHNGRSDVSQRAEALLQKAIRRGNYQRIPPVWRGLTLDLEGGSGQAYAWVGPPRPDAPGLPNAALVFILTS